MSRPLPPCPFLTSAGFASSDWQRWFDQVGQELRRFQSTAGAPATTLPAAAVDLPTVIALANAMRTALIAHGIGV